MICVVDASVAVKWFAEGDWALREDDIDPALEILKASTRGTLDFYQPPHFLAEVAAVVSRLKPDRAQQYIDDLAQLNITWASPTVAYGRAIELARQLDHHLFDTLYHAVALSIPGAVLVTADRRYFTKAQHLGQIAWLADFSCA
ncbi:MAG: type II toxin-antitoxin system VapC family toxin [Polaromonas sp.]|jgi:predicted nucleic acid-binding protein